MQAIGGIVKQHLEWCMTKLRSLVYEHVFAVEKVM